MASSSSEPLDLIVTVVSAKHLKNVNWRNGDLKPYVVLSLDPDHRLTTRSDESTKPVWNERITLPLARSVHESVLVVEIFHSDSSDPAKSLVGSVRFPLVRLGAINSLELIRPSGRTQGKIRLKLEIKKRLNYYSAPQGNTYYYRDFSPSPYPLTDHYYSRFYYPPPPPPPRSMYDRASNYSLPSVPSAPPRFPNYSPPLNGPPSDAFLVNEAPRPSGPSAPVLAPPRFPNYAPPPTNGPPSDAFLVNEAPRPSGPPSAPVDAFPVNEYKPQDPHVSSRFSSSYEVPAGPSAPVDYSPYDHRQLERTMGGLSLEEEERAVAAERSESENEFGARPRSYSYARDYRREC